MIHEQIVPDIERANSCANCGPNDSADSVIVSPPTPEESRKNRIKQTLIFIAVMAVSVGVGFFIGRLITDIPMMDRIFDALPVWLFLSLFLVGTALAIFLHEIGHLVGGLLVNFKFSLLILGPFRVSKDRRGLRFGWNRNASVAGGVASAIPEDTQNLVQRMTVMVAGGPVMSLLLVLLSGIVLAAVPSGPASLLIVVIGIGIGSLAVLVAVTVPSHTSGFLTDRAQFQLLRKGGPEAQRVAALLVLAAVNRNGERPAEWDAQMIAQSTALRDGKIHDVGAHLMAYYHWLDRGDLDKATQTLNYALRHWQEQSPLIKPTLAKEGAFLSARLGTLSQAEAWLALSKGGLVEDFSQRRTEAAMLLAKGDRKGAEGVLAEGIEKAKADPSGMAQAEAGWMAGMMDERQGVMGDA